MLCITLIMHRVKQYCMQTNPLINKLAYLYNKIPYCCLKQEKCYGKVSRLYPDVNVQALRSSPGFVSSVESKVDPLLSSLTLIAPSSFSAQENYCRGISSPPLGRLAHLSSQVPTSYVLIAGLRLCLHCLPSQTDFSGARAGVRAGQRPGWEGEGL